MSWATASDLDRRLVCPASTHLPRLVQVSENMQDAADWGHMMHRWKETGEYPKDLPKRRMTAFTDRMAALARHGQSRTSLWPAGGTHEALVAMRTERVRGVVQVELDRHDEFPDTPEGLEQKKAWFRSHDDFWVTGTMDYSGTRLWVPWVDEFKTKREVPEDPRDMKQAVFYGAWLLINSGADWAHVSVSHWPRSPAGGPVMQRFFDPAMSQVEARAFVEGLEDARQASLRSKERGILDPDARPGVHCEYCPSQLHCPEVVGYLIAPEVAQ